MANSKLTEWIKSNEKIGYSDDKIKETLMKTGFSEKDAKQLILDARNSKTSFNQFIIDKGHLFMTAFYIILVLFTLLISLLITFFNKSFIVNLIVSVCIMFTLLQLKYINTEKINQVFNIFAGAAFTLTTVLLLFFSIFAGRMSPIEHYFIYAIYFLTIGFLIDHLLSRKHQDKKKIIKAKINQTIFISIICSINAGFILIIKNLSEVVYRGLGENGSGSGGSINVLSMLAPFPNAVITFLIALIFFNVVGIYHYLKTEKKEWKLLLHYLIPLAIFVFGSTILKIILATQILPRMFG